MSEFFNGWRRKLGVATVVMACLFMGGWVRSRTTIDVILLPGKTANYFFISGGQEFQFLSAASANVSRGN